MSKEYERIKSGDSIRSVVIDKRGYYFAVDTANTFDSGPETMVFKWNRVKKDITSWKELYVRQYKSMDDAYKGHDEIVNEFDRIMYG